MAAPLPFKLTNLVSGIIITDDESAFSSGHLYTLAATLATLFTIAIGTLLLFLPINFWIGEKAKQCFFIDCYRFSIGWLVPAFAIVETMTIIANPHHSFLSSRSVPAEHINKSNNILSVYSQLLSTAARKCAGDRFRYCLDALRGFQNPLCSPNFRSPGSGNNHEIALTQLAQCRQGYCYLAWRDFHAVNFLGVFFPEVPASLPGAKLSATLAHAPVDNESSSHPQLEGKIPTSNKIILL
jgi:hypothetical protein